MHRNRIIIFLITLILTTISSYAVPFGANMHGDEASTKALPLWALHKYKYTDLLRNEPLSWCPFKSYLLVDKYVEVKDKDDKNWLIIKTDLVEAVREDAEYNKAHAIRYKGKPSVIVGISLLWYN